MVEPRGCGGFCSAVSRGGAHSFSWVGASGLGGVWFRRRAGNVRAGDGCDAFRTGVWCCPRYDQPMRIENTGGCRDGTESLERSGRRGANSDSSGFAMTNTKPKKTTKTRTTPYDVAEHLRTREEMAAHLDAWFDHALDAVTLEQFRQMAGV